MQGTENIFAKLRGAAVAALCLAAMLGMLAAAMPPAALASHEDPIVLADSDGALDDDAHYEGVLQALRENWVASFMLMTEQFVTTMINQMFIVGTFLDAQQELEVQRLYQELTAEAHKDFQPSWQMCEFGTTVRSLSAAEMIGRENAQMLDQMVEKREHLHSALSTATGTVGDITSRVRQFKDTYCDLAENNQNLELFCENSSGPVERRTKDIDYPRLVGLPYTLDANYVDDERTDTEDDIFALSRNLYASPVFDFIPEQVVNEAAGQDIYTETRSVHAIRSVARRSFNHIIGEKAEGNQDEIWKVRPFMYGILKEFGMDDDDLEDFLGENPSYFAQMEMLTRKIYQSPEFFTNLYDKPANVRRIGVALQALELMQDRDRFESALRREMLISLILELKLRAYQEDVTNAMFTSVNTKPGTAIGPP